ncbi:MAG: DUF2795 domain-containing protein [Anaerolineae bacterium]
MAVNPIQLQKYLSGISYPADKQTLIETAKGNNADDNIMNTLQQLPEQTYERPTDVTKAVGNMK